MTNSIHRSRPYTLTFRVSEREKNKWRKRYANVNPSIYPSQTDYLMTLIENQPVIELDGKALRANTIAINKIGSNINQITKQLHLRGMLLNEDSTFTELEILLEENKKLLENIWQSLKQ